MFEFLLSKYGCRATFTGAIGENLFKIEVIWFTYVKVKRSRCRNLRFCYVGNYGRVGNGIRAFRNCSPLVRKLL